VIDVDAARDHLRVTLDEPVEIEDPDVLDAAAAAIAVSPKSEAPGSSRPGPAATTTTGKDLRHAVYPSTTTRTS
jgi:hypothetical protein